MRERRAAALASLAAALVLALAAAPAARTRAQTSLSALLGRFHAVPGFRADFREEKHVALLRRPIVSVGTLHFAPPARLARHVTGASWSSIVVDGTRLVVASATERRELFVSQSGGARPFVEGFVALLAGDERALERSFTVAYTPGDPWRIQLTPRAAGSIRSVVVEGHDVRVARYRIDEASGDYSEVSLTNVDVSHAYSSAEIRRTFRPQAP